MTTTKLEQNKNVTCHISVNQMRVVGRQIWYKRKVSKCMWP